MRSRALLLALALLAVPVLAGCVDEDTPPADDGTPPANGANRAPTAVITLTPATGNADTTFTFDASGSSDPDGDALTYSWEIGTLKRTGAKVTHKFGFTDATVPVKLTVADAKGLKATATKSVKLGSGVNRAPIVSIVASPLWVKPGEAVAFDASGTTDPDGDAVTTTFGWRDATLAVDVNSGDMAANAKWSYVYETEGVYRQHCHPHPFMRHNVTVTPTAPALAEVQVEIKAMKYVPENVEVRPGTKVVYTNRDQFVHTVTLLGFEAPMTPVTAADGKGTVTFPDAGTFALVARATDAKGATTESEVKVLVDANRPDPVFTRQFTGSINATGLGLPGGAGDETPAHSFGIDYPGKGNVTLAFTSAIPGQPAEMTLTLQRADGSAQTTATGASPLVLPADVVPGSWIVKVTGERAVRVDYTIDVALTLSLAPPVEGGDGHSHEH